MTPSGNIRTVFQHTSLASAALPLSGEFWSVPRLPVRSHWKSSECVFTSPNPARPQIK
eukprot:COSAG01_NODE_47240_length_392_cov_1.034130_1_plen_57_part_01